MATEGRGGGRFGNEALVEELARMKPHTREFWFERRGLRRSGLYVQVAERVAELEREEPAE